MNDIFGMLEQLDIFWVRVVGQGHRSKFNVAEGKNVAKVAGATSRDDFPVRERFGCRGMRCLRGKLLTVCVASTL